MIILTRLHGQPFALNPDLVERAESTPDTVITLVNGTRYVVAEDLHTLVRLMREHRAGVLVIAHDLETLPVSGTPSLRVVPDVDRGR